MTHSNLESARQRVARMRAALIAPTPDAIERCLPGLAEAADFLSEVERDLAVGGPRNIIIELHALRHEISALNRLIGRGAAFYRGWAGLLGATACGYTPNGVSALAPAATISVRG